MKPINAEPDIAYKKDSRVTVVYVGISDWNKPTKPVLGLRRHKI